MNLAFRRQFDSLAPVWRPRSRRLAVRLSSRPSDLERSPLVESAGSPQALQMTSQKMRVDERRLTYRSAQDPSPRLRSTDPDCARNA